MADITPDFPVTVNDSGLGQDGTVFDAAFFATIKTAINNQVFSATNPAVTPKAIMDEVVTARGTLGSLDARLSVSLNADGTLKTQASLLSLAQAKAMLASRNVAQNGDLADWTAGAAAAPDSFVLSGAGAVIAQTGPAMGDAFTFGAGKYAAKLTRVGNDVKLTQTVIAAVDFADYADAKGMKVSAAMRGKTAIANHLRITIDDGATQDSSGYHSGGGAAEVVKFDGHVISNAATKLEIYAEVKASNGDAYVGGFQVVFFDYAPSDWMPLSLIGDASLTSKGQVSLGTQGFAGQKQFALAPVFKPGGAAAFAAKVVGVVYVNIADVGNVGGGDGRSDVPRAGRRGAERGRQERAPRHRVGFLRRQRQQQVPDREFRSDRAHLEERDPVKQRRVDRDLLRGPQHGRHAGDVGVGGGPERRRVGRVHARRGCARGDSRQRHHREVHRDRNRG
jgi:hypothetical protein